MEEQEAKYCNKKQGTVARSSVEVKFR